jgi:predicted Rossmann fold nucleotide-binding protein DprA/Smf involved in DNA uptake
MSSISQMTQAILLLTSNFSKNKEVDVTPLNPSEWGYFAFWLHKNNLTPDDLLKTNFKEILQDWNDEKITIQRIEKLLHRGGALALAMEKWQRIGIWVINRSDPNYPKQLKKKLKTLSPPILYGVGNQKLLNKESMGVIGSKKISKENLIYAFNLGEKIANDGYTLLSNGLLESAVEGTLNVGGSATIFLSNNLLKSSLSSFYRNALMDDSLVLVSPYYPESLYNTSHSIENNKYIYTQSTTTTIIDIKDKDIELSISESIDNKQISLLIKDNLSSKNKSFTINKNPIQQSLFGD